MNVIKQPSNYVLNKIGESTTDSSINYRLMKFCVMNDVEGGKIWSNQITRSVVYIPNEQFSKIYDHEDIDYLIFLRRNYFLVPEDFDEYKLVEDFRAKNRRVFDEDTWLKDITGYTILTTTGCNARCAYCYEKGTRQYPMTLETADKIVKYIVKNTPTGKTADLRWFGGEPLFNQKVMDRICTKLGEKNVPYLSSITSNGYLFSEPTVKKAIELWKLRSVQITLDGTEEVYNKTKNYIYKNAGSAFLRVLDNIQRLLDNNIRVSIRMNLSLENAEDLKKLVVVLRERFGLHRLFSMYAYPLFDEENKRTDEEKAAIYKALEELESVIAQNGYVLGPNLGDSLAVYHCMSDSGNSVVFAPDGSMGLCEHYVDRDFFSHVDNSDKIDWDMVHKFREHVDYYDFCKDCPNFPNCTLVKICADQGKCDLYVKAWYIRKLKYQLQTIYSNWLRNRNNNSCQNKCNTENCNNGQCSCKTKLSRWQRIKNAFKAIFEK